MQATAVLRRIITVCVCFLTTCALAQEFSRFNFSAGAGVSFPTADASGKLNTGWTLDFRGGYNVTRNLLADLDFTYNHWGLSRSALASFGQPGGYGDVWSLTFAPQIRFAPERKIDPYILAGAGVYHRNLSLTQPATLQTIYCDPFFGFCYPAVVPVNQVVASFSTYKGGFNAGRGIDVRIASRMKLFAEARYHEMFTTRGPNLTLAPLTFGLRW